MFERNCHLSDRLHGLPSPERPESVPTDFRKDLWNTLSMRACFFPYCGHASNLKENTQKFSNNMISKISPNLLICYDNALKPAWKHDY